MKSLQTLKLVLNQRIAQLVEDDDDDGLQEALLSEMDLEALVINHKGTVQENGLKEINKFSKMVTHVLHYACALDSVKCCNLLLDSTKLCFVSTDAIDRSDGCSVLHFASFYHSHKCLDTLLKRSANCWIVNRDSKTPLEEALFCLTLQQDLDLSCDAVEIVKKIGQKDLSVVKKLCSNCNCKDSLAKLAFKLVKDFALVQLVALLYVRRSLVNVVIKLSESEHGTIIDFLLEHVLSFSLLQEMNEKTQIVVENKTSEIERNMKVETTKQKASINLLEDRMNGMKSKKDIVTMKEFFKKYSAGQAERAENSLKNSNKGTYKSAEKLTRKMLECCMQFVQGWKAHSKDNCPPLIRAIQANDHALLSSLLASSFPVNAEDQDGNTVLHWAIKLGTSVIDPTRSFLAIEKVLNAGASIRHGNKAGASPVHTAAGYGHFEALSLFINKDRDVINILSASKETPLHFAARNNHMECAALLLKQGANKELLSLKNEKPVHVSHSREMSDLLSLNGNELRVNCDKIISSHDKDDVLQRECYHSGSIQKYPHEAFVKQQMEESGKQCEKSITSGNWTMDDLHNGFDHNIISAVTEKSVGEENLSEWQMVQRKQRKQSSNLNHRPNEKGISNKALSLPPYKSVVCRTYGNGKKCEWGSKCHFAHSRDELSINQQLALSNQDSKSINKKVPITDFEVNEIDTKPRASVPVETNSNGSGGLAWNIFSTLDDCKPTMISTIPPSGRVGTPSSSNEQVYSTETVSLDVRKVFIGGLPFTIGESELLIVMESNFGKVNECKVISRIGEDGVIRSRGFAFVIFETQEHAAKAITQRLIAIHGKNVEMKPWMSSLETSHKHVQFLSGSLGELSPTGRDPLSASTLHPHILNYPNGLDMGSSDAGLKFPSRLNPSKLLNGNSYLPSSFREESNCYFSGAPGVVNANQCEVESDQEHFMRLRKLVEDTLDSSETQMSHNRNENLQKDLEFRSGQRSDFDDRMLHSVIINMNEEVKSFEDGLKPYNQARDTHFGRIRHQPRKQVGSFVKGQQGKPAESTCKDAQIQQQIQLNVSDGREHTQDHPFSYNSIAFKYKDAQIQQQNQLNLNGGRRNTHDTSYGYGWQMQHRMAYPNFGLSRLQYEEEEEEEAQAQSLFSHFNPYSQSKESSVIGLQQSPCSGKSFRNF